MPEPARWAAPCHRWRRRRRPATVAVCRSTSSLLLLETRLTMGVLNSTVSWMLFRVLHVDACCDRASRQQRLAALAVTCMWATATTKLQVCHTERSLPPCWAADPWQLETAARQLHGLQRGMLSLAGAGFAWGPAPGVSLDAWVAAALDSLQALLDRYGLVGLDINYEVRLAGAFAHLQA